MTTTRLTFGATRRATVAGIRCPARPPARVAGKLGGVRTDGQLGLDPGDGGDVGPRRRS